MELQSKQNFKENQNVITIRKHNCNQRKFNQHRSYELHLSRASLYCHSNDKHLKSKKQKKETEASFKTSPSEIIS